MAVKVYSLLVMLNNLETNTLVEAAYMTLGLSTMQQGTMHVADCAMRL